MNQFAPGPILDRAEGPRAASPDYRMLIGGTWREARDRTTIESIDPATEQPIATFPHAKDADIDDAVRAAQEGFAEWSSLGSARRAKAMRELAARMADEAEHFAALDALDSGKPIAGLRRDSHAGASEVLYFAGLATELKGATFESPADVMAGSYREPYGVCGRIIPFNNPFRFCAKIAPIIAAGNAVILKPSEVTSLSALDFGALTLDLFPPGVVNVVTGLGSTAGAAIVRHPDVPRLAFTGGVETGKAIAREAGAQLKRCSFELGGKNPMVVFPDADIDKAAAACIAGMGLARAMGQSCQSNSRVFVHDAIHDRFLDAVARRAEELKIGDPGDEAIDIGPLAYESHFKRVLSYIDIGKAEGARLVTGGGRPAEFTRGYYVAPTVFADVDMSMRIASEEIFGPVISLFRWHDWDRLIADANSVRFGLTANIWTDDLQLALKTAKAVHAGLVWVNGKGGGRVPGAPFGGFKESGIGKEGDLSDLLSYTQEKYLQIHFG